MNIIPAAALMFLLLGLFHAYTKRPVRMAVCLASAVGLATIWMIGA